MKGLFHVNASSDVPAYRQLVDEIRSAVKLGQLAPGEQLPTVLSMAEELGLARGTIQRAYDELERLDLVEKIQGRGTFVRSRPPGTESRKERAMEIIDRMLDQMGELGFSVEELSIFLDLKLRERAMDTPSLRAAVIECNPENLSQMARQLRQLEGVELYSYLLSHVEAYPYNLDEEMDLIVTTGEHAGYLASLLPEREKIARIALRLSLSAMEQLLRLQPGERVGILTCSRRFGDLLFSSCRRLAGSVSAAPPAVISQELDWNAFLADKTALLVPEDLEKYLDQAGGEALEGFSGRGKVIRCAYEVDEGSLLHLQEKIERLREKK